MDIIGYYEQDIEVDANSFAIYLIETIFKKKCFIKEKFDREKIEFYMSLYKSKYNENIIKYFMDKVEFTPLKLFDL